VTSSWRDKAQAIDSAATGKSDDALIAKLCARAWDPGQRFDHADVPLAWIEDRYGREHLEQVQGRAFSFSDAGTVTLEAHAEEVASYFAAAPREPMFPPVTSAEVEAAEHVIGRPLPALLRRIYTEVGDGGFGPDTGLAALTAGRRAPKHIADWPCAVDIHQRNRAAGLPASWLHLTYGGCTMQWHVSLLAADNPVLLYDTDGWGPNGGEEAHDGLRYATASLRQWWWTWANGGDVWADVISAATPITG
jgi:hypothetical protein